MNHTEVLVLNGSPGSGKTTLANAIAERLREMEIPHAVIDVDEFARVYPEVSSSLGWRNLRAVWPNYASIPNLRAILPVCIDSKQDFEQLRNAVPSRKFTVCELVADELILKERVTRREPNEDRGNRERLRIDRNIGE
jgi:ABC-type lipoprotein export system ATPase subunit